MLLTKIHCSFLKVKIHTRLLMGIAQMQYPDKFHRRLTFSVSGCFGDLHRFDTVQNGWVEIGQSEMEGTLPSPRYGHGFSSANGKLYVHSGNCGPLREATGTHGNTSRMNANDVVSALILDSAGYGADLYEFNPSTSQWKFLSRSISGSDPAIRVFHGFATLNNRCYIFGGFNPYAGA